MVSSLYWLLTSSYINVFLVFVPLGIVAELASWPAVWRFSLNFLAIVPLAKVSSCDDPTSVSLLIFLYRSFWETALNKPLSSWVKPWAGFSMQRECAILKG
jgi:hypothetical protein